MSIDALPALDRTSPTFKADVDLFFGTKLPAFSTQVEAARQEVVAKEASATSAATTATTKASEASSSAVAASGSASAAASSAAAAAISAATAAGYGNALSGTSTTSLAIGTGAKSFAASTGKQWGVGQFLLAASAANPANYMHGQVTSYDSGTGALVLNVLDVGGSGTKADWTITLSAPKGDTGAAGATSYLTRVEVSGTSQSCAAGNEYWAENAAATAFTAPASPADGDRFAVVPANGLKTNTVDFGAATVRGPVATVTGVLTLDLGLRAEFRYSSTLTKWMSL